MENGMKIQKYTNYIKEWYDYETLGDLSGYYHGITGNTCRGMAFDLCITADIGIFMAVCLNENLTGTICFGHAVTAME